MIFAAFLTGVVAGIVIGGALASHKVRKAEAEMLDLLFARHSVELSVEEAIRRGGA